MIVIGIGIVAVFVTLIFFNPSNRHFSTRPTHRIKRAESQEVFEAEKNRLRQEVLAIVAAQHDLPPDCLDRIKKEIQTNLCESYYKLNVNKLDGGAVTERAPTTLWDILRWCVLRNDEQTREKARNLEAKSNPRSDDLLKRKPYHLYSTWRRVDKLFDELYPNAPAEHRNAWFEKLDQQTLATFNELATDLSTYGSKLINREPRQKKPVASA